VDFISKFDLWQEDILFFVVDQRYCLIIARRSKPQKFRFVLLLIYLISAKATNIKV